MEAEIKFEPSGRSGSIPTGTYLFDAARRLGVEIEDECGRKGECDSCAVQIVKGAEFLSSVTKAETQQLDAARRKSGERLSCQAKIEKKGEIVVMTKQKKQDDEAAEEKRMKDFRKEFAELPLEKKVANLLDLEMVTLGETFSFVLNSPYKIVGKVMDVMAEFGLKLEDDEKKAKRPTEHTGSESDRATENPAGATNNKNQARKRATAKKSQTPSDDGEAATDKS